MNRHLFALFASFSRLRPRMRNHHGTAPTRPTEQLLKGVTSARRL
jgi:hypothetical protein